MNPKNLMPTMVDTSDSFLKDVLASASLDQPPPDAKNATLAALGLAVPAAVAATTAVAAAASSTSSIGSMATATSTSTTAAVVSSSTTTVTKVATVSAVGMTKWVAGGLAMLAVASGVAYGVRNTSSSLEGAGAAPSSGVENRRAASTAVPGDGLSVTTATTPVVSSPMRDEAPAPAVGSNANAASASRVAAPTPPPKPTAEARVAPNPAPAPVYTSTLARETALLSEVREALAAGDASTARSRLHAYDAEFPDGMLKREATVLRGRLPAP